MAFLYILIVFLILLVVVLIYVVIRLNKYIAGLEESHEMEISRVDNLQDSMQRALKESLFKDGTLKKPLVSVDEMS